MKNKKIFMIFTITLIIILLGLGVFIRYNINKEKNLIAKIESKLDLTDTEKKDLNYEELIEDIKSLENGKGIINAKFLGSEDQIFKHEGDGYTIEITGGRRM